MGFRGNEINTRKLLTAHYPESLREKDVLAAHIACLTLSNILNH